MLRTIQNLKGCCVLAAVGMTAMMVSGAAADTVVLSFDSQPGFTGDDRFSVSTEHLHWWDDGYASQGVMYTWDMENDGPALGRLKVDAADGFEIAGLSFELAGYRDVASSLSFEFYVDGILQNATADLEFDGASTLFTMSLPKVMGSSFEIVLDNYLAPAHVGLDNVTFELNAIPAPGAVALLGLAGLTARRRRS